MQLAQDKFFILISSLLMLGLIYLLSPVLTPFIIAALLAYLANPMVRRLMSLHLTRVISVSIVFLFLTLLLIIVCMVLIPFLIKQINIFIRTIPDILIWAQSYIPWISEKFGIDPDMLDINYVKNMVIENWTQVDGAANWVLKSALHSGFRLFEWLMNLLLIPVVTFYLLCDWPHIIKGIRSLLPRRIEPTVVKILAECDEVLGAFLRGQLMVMLALATIYSIGLTLIGIKMGLLIGITAGLLCIVPYLGTLFGITVASITAFVQFPTLTQTFLVLALFIGAQALDHVFLTPKLVGDRIGLHPVAVIFAILAGGSLFGFIGVLIALPAAAVMMVWVRHLHRSYHNSRLYRA
jgi:predicted PurR-regulated permease PerM